LASILKFHCKIWQKNPQIVAQQAGTANGGCYSSGLLVGCSHVQGASGPLCRVPFWPRLFLFFEKHCGTFMSACLSMFGRHCSGVAHVADLEAVRRKQLGLCMRDAALAIRCAVQTTGDMGIREGLNCFARFASTRTGLVGRHSLWIRKLGRSQVVLGLEFLVPDLQNTTEVLGFLATPQAQSFLCRCNTAVPTTHDYRN